MASYQIVDATPAHIRELAENLREEDRLECELDGISARRAIWRSYRASMLRRTVLVDGKVAGMWGMGGNLLDTVGHPWMMTSPAIETIRFSFYKEAQREVYAMLQMKPRLLMYVAAFHSKALRFWKSQGFYVGKPEPLGETLWCRIELCGSSWKRRR